MTPHSADLFSTVLKNRTIPSGQSFLINRDRLRIISKTYFISFTFARRENRRKRSATNSSLKRRYLQKMKTRRKSATHMLQWRSTINHKVEVTSFDKSMTTTVGISSTIMSQRNVIAANAMSNIEINDFPWDDLVKPPHHFSYQSYLKPIAKRP